MSVIEKVSESNYNEKNFINTSMKKVKVFTVRNIKKDISIYTLYKKFGENIPYFSGLEGNHPDFIICADLDNDSIHKICTENGFVVLGYSYLFPEKIKDCYDIYDIVVSETHFNSKYRITMEYGNPTTYFLEKIKF